MANGPRIVLIHAVQVAMQPVADAFAAEWPDADTVNLLEDSLSGDRAGAGALTPPIAARIVELARYGCRIGADGILFTCSAFGPAIETAAAECDVPVLKPNEAMFELALEAGDTIGMLATFEPSVDSMADEFAELATARGRQAVLHPLCVPRAMTALKTGDADTHNALLADAAPRLSHCDAVMLAHFSTARATASVAAAIDRPVLNSPASAVRKLKSLLA